jgi:hypothetical protein
MPLLCDSRLGTTFGPLAQGYVYVANEVFFYMLEIWNADIPFRETMTSASTALPPFAGLSDFLEK